MEVDQLSVDQLSVDQLSVDQLSVDQLRWSHIHTSDCRKFKHFIALSQVVVFCLCQQLVGF
jgi:hypothetical protein